MFDYHMHSNISADSEARVEDMCAVAKKAGIKEICFTEHFDMDFPLLPDLNFIADFEAYDEQYRKVKDSYPGLAIKQGLEVGIMEHVAEKTTETLKNREFDFIIASQHVIRGEDPFEPKFFENRTEREAYEMYFEEVYKSLKCYDHYNVIGHFGVPSRFSPYAEKRIAYEKYPDVIDAVLKHLIERGKGIEANTVGYLATGEPIPSFSIIKRYRELKGEVITVGSDSHVAGRVGENCQRTVDMLKSFGFRYVCTFDKMKCIYNKI